MKDQVKAELIIEISGARNEGTCVKILKLLDILIDETRMDNDRAEETAFRWNQGKIQGFLELKELIERGLPGSYKNN